MKQRKQALAVLIAMTIISMSVFMLGPDIADIFNLGERVGLICQAIGSFVYAVLNVCLFKMQTNLKKFAESLNKIDSKIKTISQNVEEPTMLRFCIGLFVLVLIIVYLPIPWSQWLKIAEILVSFLAIGLNANLIYRHMSREIEKADKEEN
jgi:hypothetical protein